MILAALPLIPACQHAEPCSNDELLRGVVLARELRDAHPLAIGRSVARDVAGASIRAACPGLPVVGVDPLELRVDDEMIRRSRAAFRETCTDFDAAIQARNEAMQRDNLSLLGSRAAVYTPCDFGRFGLVDSVRFGLSDEGEIGLASYDHMVRQGADPVLAAELASELFWQSPWALSEVELSRLPIAKEATSIDRGVAIRITREGITVGVAGEVLPADAIDEAMTRVQPRLHAWKATNHRGQLVVVADADVPRARVSALVDAAFAHGADDVVALAKHAAGGVVFAPIEVPPDAAGPDRGALVVDELTARWQGGTLVLDANARVTIDTGAGSRILVKASCGDPMYSRQSATSPVFVGELPARNTSIDFSTTLFVTRPLDDRDSGCRVTTFLEDPTRAPALRDRVDLCWESSKPEPAACPSRSETGPGAWSIEQVETYADEVRFYLRAGRLAPPERLVVLTSCPREGARAVEVAPVGDTFAALDAGDTTAIYGRVRFDNALGLSACGMFVIGVASDSPPTIIGRACVRPGAVDPGECPAP